MQLYKGEATSIEKRTEYKSDLLMMLMEALLEVHVFIIRVKRKFALGRRLDKQGKRQSNALRKILAYTSLVTDT